MHTLTWGTFPTCCTTAPRQAGTLPWSLSASGAKARLVRSRPPHAPSDEARAHTPHGGATRSPGGLMRGARCSGGGGRGEGAGVVRMAAARLSTARTPERGCHEHVDAMTTQAPSRRAWASHRSTRTTRPSASIADLRSSTRHMATYTRVRRHGSRRPPRHRMVAQRRIRRRRVVSFGIHSGVQVGAVSGVEGDASRGISKGPGWAEQPETTHTPETVRVTARRHAARWDAIAVRGRNSGHPGVGWEIGPPSSSLTAPTSPHLPSSLAGGWRGCRRFTSHAVVVGCG